MNLRKDIRLEFIFLKSSQSQAGKKITGKEIPHIVNRKYIAQKEITLFIVFGFSASL